MVLKFQLVKNQKSKFRNFQNAIKDGMFEVENVYDE